MSTTTTIPAAEAAAELLFGLQTLAGQLEYVRANMPDCPQARDLASILDGGLPELAPYATQLAATVGVQRREDTIHYDRGYQAMHLLAEFSRTGRQDPAAWQEHPSEFMARIRAQRNAPPPAAAAAAVARVAGAAATIVSDEDTEVGYMLADEHAPAAADARLSLFCLLTAMQWGVAFNPCAITGHDEEPIEVVDDPENETWRAPDDGEEPTHRWYVFNGLHAARIQGDGPAPTLAACDPTFPVHVSQAHALMHWAYTGPDAAVIQLTSRPDGALYAVQGDEDVTIPWPSS